MKHNFLNVPVIANDEGKVSVPASMNAPHLKLFVAVLGVLVLAVVAGCEEHEALPEVQEVPRNVRVLNLASETVAEYFEISGPVTPVRGTDLSAEESGPVVAISAKKGSTVLAGEIIIEQERQILKAEKEAAIVALAAQSYNVDKVRKLHQAGKVSQIELLNAESAEAQVAAMATMTAERYRRAAIRAPFDGVVADRYIEMGQLVMPGMRAVRIIDPYTLKLEAYLTDQQIRWVTVGARAEVLLGESVAPAAGSVTWVGFEADRLTGKFKVEIELPNEDLRLRSGVIGRARLGKNISSDVVAIPRDAVLSGRVGPTAFVVENDRAILRQLTLGVSQGLMVVVTDGLAKGDQLVVRGQRELRDGSLVKITETAETTDGATGADPRTVTRANVGSRIPADRDQQKAIDATDVEAH